MCKGLAVVKRGPCLLLQRQRWDGETQTAPAAAGLEGHSHSYTNSFSASQSNAHVQNNMDSHAQVCLLLDVRQLAASALITSTGGALHGTNHVRTSGLVCGQGVVTGMLPQSAGHGRAWVNQVQVIKGA